MNKGYYFSHDANAHNDPKILRLRVEHGWAGYGIYWLLIEMLFITDDSCLELAALSDIGMCYNIDITLLQRVLDTCIRAKLFCSDGQIFYSEGLRKRKEYFLECIRKKSEAGKKGMLARYGKQGVSEDGDNTVITPAQHRYNTDCNTDITIKLNDIKRTKGNDTKRKEKTTTASDVVKDVFEHWNAKTILVHKTLTSEHVSDIAKALKLHTPEELKLAMDHYATMFHDSAYEFCSYKWGIHEFLTREEGYIRFLDDGSKWQNYLSHQQNNQPVSKPNTLAALLAGPATQANDVDPNAAKMKLYERLHEIRAKAARQEQEGEEQ